MVHLLLTELPNWANPKYFNLYNCSNSNSIGCILKVDLDCLDELRDLHNYIFHYKNLKLHLELILKF